MFLPLIIGLTGLFVSPGSFARPAKFGTTNIIFYPDSSLVINAGDFQIYR
jgi:hypothetical protein